MRRSLAVTAVALLAACSPEGGSAANGQDDGAADRAARAQPSRAPRPTGDTTPEGLAFFHLAESGQGRVSFSSSETQGGVQVLSDVTIVGEDGEELQAETVRISGARETPEGTIFDSLEILNISATPELPASSPADPPKKGATATGEPTTTEGSFTLDRFVIEQPNALLASFIAQALSAEGVDEDANWGAPSQYAFETVSMEGFNAEFDGGQVSFDNLSFTGYENSKLGGFAFENLVGGGTADDGTDVSFELARFVFNGLDLTGLDAVATAEEDPEAAQRALIEAGFGNPFRKYYDDYAFEGLHVDFGGVVVSLASVVGDARQTRAGVTLSDAMDGLVVEFDETKELGAQGLEWLQMLGYDRVEVHMNSVVEANEVQDRISTDDYSLRAVDAFTLEIDYDIGGFKEYLAAAIQQGSFDYELMDDPAQATEVFSSLVIHGLEIRLTDDSLVERALQAAADMQGSTPDAVRQQATAMMGMGTLMAPPGPIQALVGQAIGAAGDFLEEPGTLIVSVAPSEPVSFAELMTAFESGSPDQAVGLLNISVESTN